MKNHFNFSLFTIDLVMISWLTKVNVVAFLLLSVVNLGQGREPFTADDLWDWHSASDAQISSDGRRIAYVEELKDRQSDAAWSNLWLATADGRLRQRLTEGPWRDDWPRWSPDGERIAYRSNRTGGAGIRVRRLDSGADSAVVAATPDSLAWSPDGRSIAFTAWVPRTTAADWAPPAILPHLASGIAGSEELFIVPAGGGAARQITHDSFVKRGSPVWTPDGRWILNAAERAPDAASPLEGAELYAVQVADGSVRRLTEHPGPDENPVVSPDGAKVAWIRAETRPAGYAIRKLYVMNADGSRVRALTGSLDRNVVAPQWSSDSRTVYFLADDQGSTHVYLARNDGTVRQVTNRVERLRGFSLADNGRAATVRWAATDAGSVVTFAVDLPGGVTTVAAPNDALLAGRDIGPVEELRFESAGKNLQAWLTKPLRMEPGRRYPLLLDVHDDPRAMCGPEFGLRAQILAARGLLVLCVNPRGTPGYGEDFGNLLSTRFPGDDFDDLMRGVETAAARPDVDPQRLMLAGGLLAAWAIGHTDRFRAAVARHPIAEWVSGVALAPDGFRRAAAWMGAMPWDDPDQYVKHSPLFSASSFKTPTLVIAGESDPGAEELYFALQARKVDRALVHIPGDGKPGTAVLELETILAWLARF